jgi:hypothetical protein
MWLIPDLMKAHLKLALLLKVKISALFEVSRSKSKEIKCCHENIQWLNGPSGELTQRPGGAHELNIWTNNFEINLSDIWPSKVTLPLSQCCRIIGSVYRQVEFNILIKFIKKFPKGSFRAGTTFELYAWYKSEPTQQLYSFEPPSLSLTFRWHGFGMVRHIIVLR